MCTWLLVRVEQKARTRRLSREAGHRRKFLAIVDETPESERAIAYAARRAFATGGVLVLLYVVEPGDFQHWLGVEQIMREEANATATAALNAHAARIRETIGIEPELVTREGKAAEEIHKLIEEDQDIAILVLAAGNAKEGPGPLVSSIAGKGAAFPIPVTVVPMSLSDEDMVALQRANLIDPSSPNPSVETLLHAFLPHKFIDHTHSTAILAIVVFPRRIGRRKLPVIAGVEGDDGDDHANNAGKGKDQSHAARRSGAEPPADRLRPGAIGHEGNDHELRQRTDEESRQR